jgi:hypothetical protein
MERVPRESQRQQPCSSLSLRNPEHKYYAPDVGLVQDGTLRLVRFGKNAAR